MIGLAIWGVVHDVNQVRVTLVASQMERMRSHALRTVGLFQSELLRNNSSDLTPVGKKKGLRRFWREAILDEDSWLYAAAVDPSGKVIVHSDVALEGQQIGPVWYERVIPEGVADDVPVAELPLDQFLEPASKRQILMRLLRNLKAIYRDADKPERELEVLNRMLAVTPEAAAELRDRGQVYQRL